MTVLTRGRSSSAAAEAAAAATAAALSNLLGDRTALDAIANALGLRHRHCLRGVCKQFDGAWLRAQDRWTMLLRPIFGPVLSDSSTFGETLHYIAARSDGRGFAIPSSNHDTVLLYTPSPELKLEAKIDLCLKSQHYNNGSPELRGLACIPNTSGGESLALSAWLEAAQTVDWGEKRPQPTHRIMRLYSPDQKQGFVPPYQRHARVVSCSGREDPRMQFPSGVCWHGGRCYVSDVFNHRIVVLDASLNPVRTGASRTTPLTYGSFGSLPGQLITPFGLDAMDSLLFVCDNGNHRVSVCRVDDGAHVKCLGNGGEDDRFSLNQPRDCAAIADAASRARWLVVSEATRLQVLDIGTGAHLQLVEIANAFSLWGVCVVEPPAEWQRAKGATVAPHVYVVDSGHFGGDATVKTMTACKEGKKEAGPAVYCLPLREDLREKPVNASPQQTPISMHLRSVMSGGEKWY